MAKNLIFIGLAPQESAIKIFKLCTCVTHNRFEQSHCFLEIFQSITVKKEKKK